MAKKINDEKTVKYGGRWYSSLNAASRATGVPASALSRNARRLGADLDAAGYVYRDPAIHGRGNRKTFDIVCNGEKFDSIREFAEAFGLEYPKAWTLHNLYGDSIPYKEVETARKKNKYEGPKKIKIGGVTHESISAAARAGFGASWTLSEAVKKYGPDLDAAGYKPRKKTKLIRLGALQYESGEITSIGARGAYRQKVNFSRLENGERLASAVILVDLSQIVVEKLEVKPPYYAASSSVAHFFADRFGLKCVFEEGKQ